MVDCLKRGFLLLRCPAERQAYVGQAIIGRKVDFCDAGRTDPGIFQLIGDHFVEFFANALRDAFVAVGVQVSGSHERCRLDNRVYNINE